MPSFLEQSNEFTLREASTLMLLRDNAGILETLLLCRSNDLAFAAGHWVFPGGTLEEADRRDGRTDMAALRRAAVRETFEETGLCPDSGRLVYFAQFTTPGGRKRFKTWFFACPVDAAQSVSVDNTEITRYRWLSAGVALDMFRRGEIKLMPPTMFCLMRLTSYSSAAEACQAFAGSTPMPILPVLTRVDGTPHMLFPGDAGYAAADPAQEGARHRLIMTSSVADYRYEYDGVAAVCPRLDGGYFLTQIAE